MPRTIVIPNEVFFENLLDELHRSGTVRLPVKGNSMFPFLRDSRDAVVLRALEDGETPVVGDICLFRFNGRYILHRLVGRKGEQFVFRGDGNPRGKETVPADSIFAVAEKKIAPSGEETDCRSEDWRRFSRFWPKTYLVRRLLIAVLHRILG